MSSYRDILNMLGRFRARRRSMIHRHSYAAYDLMWIDWMIGTLEAAADYRLNGEPF